MLAIIDQHRDEIVHLCRRYGVRSLDLFGSATSAEFNHERSDVDFIVEFSEQVYQGAADRYFGLLESLQRTLGRPVDLVMRNAMRNPYFLRATEQQRLRLYAA